MCPLVAIKLETRVGGRENETTFKMLLDGPMHVYTR